MAAAWDAGIRTFDTAPHYGLGLSERRLGAALRGRPRDTYTVSTKVGRLLVPNPGGGAGDDLAHGFAVPATHRRVWDFTADGVLRSLEASLGRLGLLIHSTAGFVDAGWDGHLTLELSNVATLPIALYPTMKIGQISFFQMTTAAEHPYGSAAKGSKYQGQRGPTPSRYYLNFRDGS